jgi:hypothetical protein
LLGVGGVESEVGGCAECGSADVVTYFSNGVGELVAYCAECAKREFDWEPPSEEPPVEPGWTQYAP